MSKSSCKSIIRGHIKVSDSNRFTPVNRQSPSDFIANSSDDLMNAVSGSESSYGDNLHHALITKGPSAGMRAGGAYGLTPTSAQEIYDKNEKLRNMYPQVEDFMLDVKKNHPQITQLLNDDPQMAYDFSKADQQDRLQRLKGNLPKSIYSHLNGVSGSVMVPQEKVLSNPYVKSVLGNLQDEEDDKHPMSIANEPLPRTEQDPDKFMKLMDILKKR